MLLKKAGEDIEKDLEDFEKKAVRELTSAAVHKGLLEADKVIKGLDKALAHFGDSHPALVERLNAIGDDIVLGPIVLRICELLRPRGGTSPTPSTRRWPAISS